MNNIFEIKNLNLKFKAPYGEEPFQLKNITMALDKGMILGLLGGNGMGKTTLIRCIVDNYRSYSGSISFNNETNFKDQIAYIPDTFPFNDKLKIQHIGNLMKQTVSNWDVEQFETNIDRYGLVSDMTLKDLSLGQKQRLMVAVALSQHAKLLIFDEPTDGIDPFDRELILEDIRNYHYEENATIIISSHNTKMLDDIVDYVAYLDKGSLVYLDDIETLRTSGYIFLEKLGYDLTTTKLFKEDPSLHNFVSTLQTNTKQEVSHD